MTDAVDVPRKPRKKAGRYAITAVIIVVVIGGATFGLRRLRAAVPTVESVWPDTVKRGTMIRQVQGQGTLVPEEIRWISAASNGRVERVLVQPGTPVTDDTILIELSNPDVELAALEAMRQVAAGQAELVNLQASVENQRLAQESSVATIHSSRDDATRRAKADQDLADKGYLSRLELDQSRDRATELDGRLAFEQRRLAEIQKGNSAQVEAQRAQVERLKSIAEFRQKQLDALHVRAGVTGILQEAPLQVGQSVVQGALLAKVAKPDKLKAELRIPETQIKDVTIGQSAAIDTRNGIIKGKVTRIDPASQNATVKVDVSFTGELPKAARPELTVEGTIEIERLDDVLYVGRPAFGEPNSTVKLFKITGDEAVRVPVQLGRTSVKTVEIVAGLAEGDTVILSDMSQWDNFDRVKVK